MRYPTDGASASAFGMAVIKNCKHPAAAKALVNWVCSAEGCSYIAQYLKTLRMTNKDTVYGESLLPVSALRAGAGGRRDGEYAIMALVGEEGQELWRPVESIPAETLLSLVQVLSETLAEKGYKAVRP